MASDFFADKKYQEMDWISKAVSPWEFDLLPILASIPETIEITPAMIAKSMELHGDLSLETLVADEARKLGFELRDFPSHIYPWFSLFQLDLPDDTVIDFSTMTINNPIFLRKIKPTFDENDCLKCASGLIREALGWNFNVSATSVGRAGEILDLLSVDMSKCRGARSRERELKTAIWNVIDEDKWRIRNMKLVAKLANWISAYVERGELAGMANFAKLKVMTHAGQPIYSMQEVD